MGLFDKKFCCICNEKVGILGGLKLKDGYLCKECKKKLSPFFDEGKNSTIEDIKNQLQYRENNYKELDNLEISKIYGEYGAILIDEKNKKFVAISDTSDGLFKSPKAISGINDVKDRNPDIIDFNDIEDIDVQIIQTSKEDKQTINGQQVSYNPPHLIYMISFALIIKTKHPYAKFMRISINNGTIQIYNEGRRIEESFIDGFLKDKLGYSRIENCAEINTNVTIKNFIEKSMQTMPDYSYGFKCTLKNYDEIKEYAYYLALCDEIKTTLLNK